MTDSALAVTQSNRIQQILLSENETGNQNKPPKLMSMDDYPQWKSRFEIYINGVDTNLWLRIEVGYIRPMGDAGEPVLVTRMSDEQRSQFNAEKKAYALISQALSADLFHQFQKFT